MEEYISTENVDVPLDWIYYTTDLKFIKNILKKFLNKRLKNFEFSSIINHKINLRYLKGIKVIRLLNYIPYIKKDALKFLKKSMIIKDLDINTGNHHLLGFMKVTGCLKDLMPIQEKLLYLA